ncbi:hypothetical protein [Blastopirellula retiformator]|uniref:hypothetical protein n=1 Tax=Blastopirellula retiformator TaxID=2527970 RepID=UPI0016486115|nr:hypothetical protein [Blastopirellula retiformator]
MIDAAGFVCSLWPTHDSRVSCAGGGKKSPDTFSSPKGGLNRHTRLKFIPLRQFIPAIGGGCLTEFSVGRLELKMGTDIETHEVEDSRYFWNSVGVIAWHLFWNGVHYLFAAIAVASIIPPCTSHPSQAIVFSESLPPILIAYSIACFASVFRIRYAIADALIYLTIILLVGMLNFQRLALQ